MNFDFFQRLNELASPQMLAGLSPEQLLAMRLKQFSTSAEQFGAGLSIGGTIVGGIEANKLARYEAGQLKSAAGQARAAGQRQAYNEDEKTKMVNSEILARAAASGGGASDPTILSLMAKTASEGAYHRSVALYNGEDAASELEAKARSVEYGGKTAKFKAAGSVAAQGFGAYSSLLKNTAQMASMYQRFGMGNPAERRLEDY